MADKIVIPRRIQDWITADGNFTLRALKFFENTATVTNNTTTIINQTTGQASLNAILIRLQKQVGSDQVLTIDTTGFTIDNTMQTIDQTEA